MSASANEKTGSLRVGQSQDFGTLLWGCWPVSISPGQGLHTYCFLCELLGGKLLVAKQVSIIGMGRLVGSADGLLHSRSCTSQCDQWTPQQCVEGSINRETWRIAPTGRTTLV